MKKYLVNSTFIDRTTGKFIEQGQSFGSDDGDQIARLQKRGVLGKEEMKAPSPSADAKPGTVAAAKAAQK